MVPAAQNCDESHIRLWLYIVYKLYNTCTYIYKVSFLYSYILLSASNLGLIAILSSCCHKLKTLLWLVVGGGAFLAPVEGSVEEGGAFLASVEGSVEADGLMAVVSHDSVITSWRSWLSLCLLLFSLKAGVKIKRANKLLPGLNKNHFKNIFIIF